MCLMLHGLGRSGADALEVPSHRGFELAAFGDHLACLGIGIDTCDDDVLVGAARSFDGLPRTQSPLLWALEASLLIEQLVDHERQLSIDNVKIGGPVPDMRQFRRTIGYAA